MSTILLNTENNQILGRFDPYYIIDGERPALPDGILELQVINSSVPPISKTEKLVTTWEIRGDTYTEIHTVLQKTPDELYQDKINYTPNTITKRQLLLYLYTQMNITNSDIIAMIDQSPDTIQKNITKIEWEHAAFVDRTNPSLVQFAAMLNISETQLLDIFHIAKDL